VSVSCWGARSDVLVVFLYRLQVEGRQVDGFEGRPRTPRSPRTCSHARPCRRPGRERDRFLILPADARDATETARLGALSRRRHGGAPVHCGRETTHPFGVIRLRSKSHITRSEWSMVVS
jgi:hypothetical protein